jgi:hypothetical protein
MFRNTQTGKRWMIAVGGLAGLAASGWLLHGQDLLSDFQYPVPHAECVFFGANHASFVATGYNGQGIVNAVNTARAGLTEEVTHQLPAITLDTNIQPQFAPPGGSQSNSSNRDNQLGLIDKLTFQAMEGAGVTPAPATTDFEFIRRVTLDLTGRIPTADALIAFTSSNTPNKRAALVDSLLATPAWVDKWTMFYGDLYQNNSQNSQIKRFQGGVEAFYTYLKTSLQNNKPYDQMAREIISAQGTNTYTQGELNWIIGGVVTGGPVQDDFDQQTANMADMFLGVYHVNCLLCHNGRGHLDSINLWGSMQTRSNAWGLSSFMSRTGTAKTMYDPTNPNVYYWSAIDNSPKIKTDYALNTTTGNRPARAPIGTITTVAPLYMFDGTSTPNKGEAYRTGLARIVTSDFQFARASVNFVWAHFFGMGIVDPPDQFDLARLDPDNPPPSPWILQPSNPLLLNALAQGFIDNKYDLKWLMRTIANSKTYQLSSRYPAAYNPNWNSLFARKMVRRLWSEEVHDAVTQASNVVPSYNLGTVYGTTSIAMQFPEPIATPDGANGPVNNFLNSFLRGNRDDEVRRGDGSISQALGLMNDKFVVSRISSTTPVGDLLQANIGLPNDQLVNKLFLTVLSRYPSTTEMNQALQTLSTASTRNQAAENLLWTLFNKVDFVFNY